jgi:2-polyprenyl-3-methyl-5-hydroxy-6-metoxy-1,4-benzoquinol methylase
MTTHTLLPVGRPLALDHNERNEAEAFDRLAGQRDKTTLSMSASTFSRYRAATRGRPLFDSYPDRVFLHVGRHFGRGAESEPPLRGVRILDLGAGDGVWSVILAEQGAEVTSVEIAPGQVELARERMRIHGLAWDARIGSAYSLREQFAPGGFDVIFAQAVLHHLTQGLERVYDGMHYLLRPGGLATITEPYSGSPRLQRLRERLSWLVPVDRESPDERPLRDEDLAPLVRLFSSVFVERFDLLAKFARRIFRSSEMEKAVFHFDEMVLRSRRFSRLAGGIFVAVQK